MGSSYQTNANSPNYFGRAYLRARELNNARLHFKYQAFGAKTNDGSHSKSISMTDKKALRLILKTKVLNNPFTQITSIQFRATYLH